MGLKYMHLRAFYFTAIFIHLVLVAATAARGATTVVSMALACGVQFNMRTTSVNFDSDFVQFNIKSANPVNFYWDLHILSS